MEPVMIPLRPKTSVLTQALAASCPAHPTGARDCTCPDDNSVSEGALVLARLGVNPTSTLAKSQLTDRTFVLDTSGSTTASSSTGDSSSPHTPLSSNPASPISCHSLDVNFDEDEGSSHYPEEALEAFKSEFRLSRRLVFPPCLTTPRPLAMETSQADRDLSLSGSQKPVVGIESWTETPPVSGHESSSTYTENEPKSSTGEPCMTASGIAVDSCQYPARPKSSDTGVMPKASVLRHFPDAPDSSVQNGDKSGERGNPLEPRPNAAPIVNSAFVESLSSLTRDDTPEGSTCGTSQETALSFQPNQQQVKKIGELINTWASDTNPDTLKNRVEAQASVSRCLEELSRVVDCFGLSGCGQSNHETPCGNDQSAAGSGTPGNGGPTFGGSSSQSRKRTNGQGNSEDEAPYSNGGQEDNGEDDSPMRSKKIKIEGRDNHYPCPYRKRNPLRFNIRDYNTCATNTSADLPNLKRHIKQHHKRLASLPYACSRCGADQGTRERLTCHLQLPPERLCAVRHESLSNDPEEGITPAVEDMLNERKSGTRVNTWRNLCRALFPEDDGILSSVFEPPVELDEVGREFDSTKDELRNRLRLESQTIAELSPEAQDYVAGQMERASWDYIQSVLVGSRLHADHGQAKYRGRRKSHRQGTKQPLEQDGFPSSATTVPRLILPNPFSVSGSAWQSPTSSWKTDNSDLSSCPPLSGTPCSSTASQYNQQLGVCHDGYIAPAARIDMGVGTDNFCCFTDETTHKRYSMDPANPGTYQLASSLPVMVTTWATPAVETSWATPIETSGQQLQEGDNVSFRMMVENTFRGQSSSIPGIATGSHATEVYPAGFYSIFDGP